MIADASTAPRRPGPYSYNRLKNRQWLRIVKLWPAPASQPGIDCEIVELPSLKRSTIRSGPDPTTHSKATGSAIQAVKGLPGLPAGYEAVSWYWGENNKDEKIRIHVEDEARDFDLSPHRRKLYIPCGMNSICINQDNVEERNQQVPRMSEIYGEADNVCIWLGAGSPESTKALNFIKNELKTPWKLDDVWRLANHHGSWVVLLELMKRDWFSRRWVVQEVALAKKATVHCGRQWVTWSEFETAVSVFVELEMATRRLPAVPRPDHVALSAAEDRSTFKSVPYAGASVLVDTTSRLLRKTVGGVHQRSISLEELVAKLAAQETSEPRDIIYALLALAKDTQPSLDGIATQIDDPDGPELTPAQQKSLQVIARLFPNPSRRRYVVEYKQPILNVYQQFIAFSLAQADPTRALDVVLRPFARTFKESQNYTFDKDAMERFKKLGASNDYVRLPSWIPNAKYLPFQPQLRRRQTLEDASSVSADQLFMHSMERQRGESFVGPPGSRQTSYCAAGTRAYDKNKVRFRERSDHFSLFAEGFILDTVAVVEGPATMGNIPGQWFTRWKHRVSHDWDTVWKTLVANRDSEGRNPPPFYTSALLAAFKDVPEDASFETESVSREGGAELVAKALLRVKATIYERCLVETGRGMLGLANSDVKPDDVVCILYGCSVPVIMRRSPQKSAGAIEQEKQQDEADHRERLVRIRPLLDRIFERRRKRRGTDHENEIVHGQVEMPASEASNFASADDPRLTDAAAESTPHATSPADRIDTDKLAVPEHLADPEQAVTGAADDREPAYSAPAPSGDDLQPHPISDTTWASILNRPVVVRLLTLPLFTLSVALLLGEPMVANIVTTIASTHVIHAASSHFANDKSLATMISVGSVIAASVLGWNVLRVSPIIFFLIMAAIALFFPEVFPPRILALHHMLVHFVMPGGADDTESTTAQLHGNASDEQRDVSEIPHDDNDDSATRSKVDDHSSVVPNASIAQSVAHDTRPPESDVVTNGHVRKPSRPVKPVQKPEDLNADLKPPEYYYTLIGEAYIHGMMDGEAIEWQNETALPENGPRVQAQVFEIR